MRITWNGRGISKGNLLKKTKVKKDRILLNLLLHLLLLHEPLLLHVKFPNLPQENIPININMICLYLSLMQNLNFPCLMVKSMLRGLITGSEIWKFIEVCNNQG
jgi:hypothetical protein